MKYLVSFFVIIILFFCTNVSRAENLTVLIDMDKVMNESLVGKSIIVKLEKINKKNVDEFKKKEDLLREEENSLLSQKNILSKENYSKKVDELKIKVNNCRQKIILYARKKNYIIWHWKRGHWL